MIEDTAKRAQQDSQTTEIKTAAPEQLPQCRWRTLNGSWLCQHPQVHLQAGSLTAEICGLCRLRETKGLHQRRRRRHPGVRHWAVGLTTAPRKNSTLAATLQSLAQAGWPDVRIFAEPGVLLCLEHSAGVTQRDEPLGAFPNFYLGLAELIMREPRADAYLMVQDDVLFARGLRDYFEETLWPRPSVGVISAYCPSHYSHRRSSGYRIVSHGWHTWGAQAYVFPSASARRLISDLQVVDHRRIGPAEGLRNVDSVVGAWCLRRGLPYYVHIPSLAQHVGHTSTLYPTASASGRRCAADFVENVEQLMGHGGKIDPPNCEK